MSAADDPSAAAAPLLPAARDRVNILIVDDTAPQRMAIETVLADLGRHA